MLQRYFQRAFTGFESPAAETVFPSRREISLEKKKLKSIKQRKLKDSSNQDRLKRSN